MGKTYAPKGTFIRSVDYDNGGTAAFSRKLRGAMLGRSLTRKQLAFKSGIADTTISQMTSRTGNATNHKVSLYVLVGLADGLDLPAAEVIGWATTSIIAECHIAAARETAVMRAERYRRHAEQEARRTHAATEKDPAPVVRSFLPEPPAPKPEPPTRIEPVRLAPEVSIASVMLKLRALNNEDLAIVDELLSGLAQ